ncbi:glycosyltransferase family 4 protein [Candidatus Dependentiae bacterium]|nr:glycosyltransferase family 4 protein [Candidatus Dependentiae bacterium]
MKVLVISHTYISPINRVKWQEFARRYPSVTLKVLVPQTWKTHFFNVESHSLGQDNLKNCTFVSMPTFFTGNEVLYFYSPLKFLKLMWQFKPDIIHVEQGLHAVSYLQALITNKLFGIGAQCSFFTWINWEPKSTIKTKILTSILGKINAFGSKGAIAGNADAQKIIAVKKTSLFTTVLPQLGVDPKLFKPAQHNNHLESKKYITYVGRVIEEKGVMTLVKAFSLLANQYVNWHLLIVGAGEFEKQIIDFVISKKLLHRVDFHSPVSHEKIVEFMQMSDIFVLPSLDCEDWREQFGHVLIEAMACRVCVVGSNAGEIPNVIQDAGVIFEQGDTHALYETLCTLITRPALRNTLAQKGLERVMQEYTHSVIVDKTHAFWQSLLST